MRWQVEVTSMDSADVQSVVVEAESWQKALHAARAARGEAGPISGFSIELLDEGYRAVDPLARRRYDVKRAPEGTAVTVAPAPAATMSTAPTAPPAALTVTAPAPPPAPVAPSAPSPSQTPPVVAAVAAHLPAPGPKVGSVAAAVATIANVVDDAPRPASRRPPPPPPAAHTAPAHPNQPPSKPPGPPPAASTAAAHAEAQQAIVPTAIVSVVPPQATNGSSNADATIRTDAIYVPGSLPATPHSAPYSAPPVPPSTPELEGPVPPTQVIFKREHDPNERLPLTYREYVFTVARGVNEVLGERLLRSQLDQVRASIANARPGKFVNLAVFDVVFQGKPPVPPLATLAWKDWTGEPVIAFPRRDGVNHKPAKLPSSPPPAPPARNAQVAQLHPHAPHAVPPPPHVAAPAAVAAASVAFPAPSFPAPAPTPVMAAPVMAAALPPSHQPPAQQAPSAPPPPPPMTANPFAVPFQAKAADPFAASPFAGASAPLPPGVPIPAFGAPAPPAPVAAAAVGSFPPPTSAATNAAHIAAVAPSQVPPAQPPSQAPPPPAAAFFVPAPPAPAFPSAPPPPPPAPTFAAPQPQALAPAVPPPPPAPMPVRRPSDSAQRSAQRLTPTPSRPSFRSLHGRRATGDELIANLFEAMHELQFTRDVIEGGDYVLSLAVEMIPSRAGLLHLYDINHREYVIACVLGLGSDALLNRRLPENEPLFATAMRKRRSLVFADARTDEQASATERFALLGGATSLIVSPVMKGGRFLGVLELLNPTDGVAFSEDEGNAIDYLSEQFGEFVAARGPQLDPDRIARSVPPAGLPET